MNRLYVIESFVTGVVNISNIINRHDSLAIKRTA